MFWCKWMRPAFQTHSKNSMNADPFLFTSIKLRVTSVGSKNTGAPKKKGWKIKLNGPYWIFKINIKWLQPLWNFLYIQGPHFLMQWYEVMRCITTSIADSVTQWYHQRYYIFYFQLLTFALLHLVSFLQHDEAETTMSSMFNIGRSGVCVLYVGDK